MMYNCSRCSYEGLLHIHIRVWNPLGFDRNDFPQRRYLDWTWTATHQFLRPKKRILPSFIMPKVYRLCAI
jgi:hypothetical protein